MGAVAVILAALAGVAGSVQVAVMGKFGDRIGVVPAIAFSGIVSALTATTVLLVARHGFGGLAAGLRQPPWLWIGGLLSIFIVFSMTVAGPRLGTVATIAILIAGQLVMGALIDRFGLLGVEKIGLAWPRALGLALLAAGAALSLRRS